MTLKGKTALVTGASKGVGKGIALGLARSGCNVAVHYHSDPTGGEVTVRELQALGVDAFAVPGDVGSPRDVQEIFKTVLGRCERLDILVNNAGMQTWGPLLEVTAEDWDRVIRTNLTGCFLCTQAAGRHMKEHSSGVIVNIGSGSSKVPFLNLAAYTASKGGIEMFTKAAAIELGPYGIRVNCVAPGAIEIERTRLESPDYAETWGTITPLGRVGTPRDVAGAVAFLASDEASFISGQTIWVDGAMFTQPRWPYEPSQG